MECPICKASFSKVDEVLIMADRTFTCPQCWSRLISTPRGSGRDSIEEDITGGKWIKVRESYHPTGKHLSILSLTE
jgi:DNA-directed RNA polymerase subunit RPC12/RpoP